MLPKVRQVHHEQEAITCQLLLPQLDSFRSSIDTAHARLFIACLEEDDPDVMSLVNVLRLIDVCTLGASKDEQLAELYILRI